MAYKMKLNSPHKGMAFIWNISAEVGVIGSSRNAADDVELVQRLIIERYKLLPPKTPRASGIGMLASASGRMDTQTAFDIYWASDHAKNVYDAEKVSPARGGSIWYGNGFWTIGYLNHRLFLLSQQVWAQLPELCSPALKTALLTKTTP